MSELVDHELDRLRHERDEARKQLGQVLYLTKAPSTQALVDGYLEAARLREALVRERERDMFGACTEWCEVHEAKASPSRFHDDRCSASTHSGDCRFTVQPSTAAALAPAPGPAGERQGG